MIDYELDFGNLDCGIEVVFRDEQGNLNIDWIDPVFRLYIDDKEAAVDFASGVIKTDSNTRIRVGAYHDYDYIGVLGYRIYLSVHDPIMESNWAEPYNCNQALKNDYIDKVYGIK